MSLKTLLAAGGASDPPAPWMFGREISDGSFWTGSSFYIEVDPDSQRLYGLALVQANKLGNTYTTDILFALDLTAPDDPLIQWREITNTSYSRNNHRDNNGPDGIGIKQMVKNRADGDVILKLTVSGQNAQSNQQQYNGTTLEEEYGRIDNNSITHLPCGCDSNGDLWMLRTNGTMVYLLDQAGWNTQNAAVDFSDPTTLYAADVLYNSNYLVVGGYKDNTGLNFEDEAWIAAVNGSGTVQWAKKWAWSTSSFSANQVLEVVCSDDDIFVLGATGSGGGYTNKLMKFNSSGTLQWGRSFSNITANNDFKHVVVSPDGTYVYFYDSITHEVLQMNGSNGSTTTGTGGRNVVPSVGGQVPLMSIACDNTYVYYGFISPNSSATASVLLVYAIPHKEAMDIKDRFKSGGQYELQVTSDIISNSSNTPTVTNGSTSTTTPTSQTWNTTVSTNWTDNVVSGTWTNLDEQE